MEYTSSINGVEPGSNVMSRVDKHFAVNGRDFDVLASDINATRGSKYTLSSHPDYGSGLLSPPVWMLDARITNAYWWNNQAIRGPADYNFCREDGSVFQIKRVALDDDRLSHIPYKWNNNGESLLSSYTLLPSVDQSYN